MPDAPAPSQHDDMMLEQVIRMDSDQPSPHSMANKVGRLLWGLARFLLFRPSPKPLHRFRVLILRLFRADVDWTAIVHPSVDIWAPWNLTMGPHSCLAPRVACYNVARITIGDTATVSQNVHLCGASHDYKDPKFPLIRGPITIGEGAWVCADAFVAMNVRIGKNAVIGARSVVTRDMPEGMVCAGFPCVPLKPRFADSTREKKTASDSTRD